MGNVSDPQNATVMALLDRVPGWTGRATVLGSLDGGITNRNLLVEVDDERFVLRLAGKDTHLLEIRRGDEVTAARRAASLGFAPEVVDFLEPEGYLVTRFVSGVTLTGSDLRGPATIDRVGAILRAVHSGPLLDGDFDAFRVPERHLDAARVRSVAVPEAYGACAAISARIEAAFGSSPDARVPCHNDLLPANFLRDPASPADPGSPAGTGHIWLLDWEYAGNNDRYFDLGNLAVNNEFGPDEEAALIGAYFGEATPRRLARLRLMRLMSDFREAMWGVVQQGISELDFDYVGYAETHFARLRANAGAGDLDALLEAAASGPPEPT